MRVLSLFLIVSFFGNINARAQDIEYAREVVKILTSDSLAGRGYVEDGDKKAAEFIRSQFIEFGLTSITDNYYQSFEIPINTFPDSIHLSIDGIELTVGDDFHVFPGSPSLNGEFDIVFVEKDEIFDLTALERKLELARGKVLVIDEYPDSLMDQSTRNRLSQIIQFLTRHPNNPAAATIILTSQKLTWYGSQVVDAKTSFRMQKDSFNKNASRIKIELNSEFINLYETQNVIGLIEGLNHDSVIVVMAHYDHFGKMGQALFPGANDNASGTAMLLSLAKHYSINQPEYSILFTAFGAEELGLIGSKYFVDRPPIDLSNVKFMLNFDIAGTGDEGIQVVNGSVYREDFDLLVELNQLNDLLPNIKIRGAACISDHCNFDRLEIPGFYIYTLGGIRAYHDIFDRAETLPLTEFEDYFKLMTLFIDSID